MNIEIQYKTVLALVIYGYILLAIIIFIILFFVAGYFFYKQYIKADLVSLETETFLAATTIEDLEIAVDESKVVQKSPTFQDLYRQPVKLNR